MAAQGYSLARFLWRTALYDYSNTSFNWRAYFSWDYPVSTSRMKRIDEICIGTPIDHNITIDGCIQDRPKSNFRGFQSTEFVTLENWNRYSGTVKSHQSFRGGGGRKYILSRHRWGGKFQNIIWKLGELLYKSSTLWNDSCSTYTLTCIIGKFLMWHIYAKSEES